MRTGDRRVRPLPGWTWRRGPTLAALFALLLMGSSSLGDIVVLYGTGEGQTTPGGVTGALAAQPYPRPVSPVTVLIGGHPAEILYAGAAPGYAGLMQINARIPLGVKADGGSVGLRLEIGELSSQPGVTIEIQ